MQSEQHEQMFESYHEQFDMDQYDIAIPVSLNSHPSDYSQPPVLSYSYSGISNASSNQQFCFASYHIEQNPQQALIFLKPQQLYDDSIVKLINDVNETLVLNPDLVLFLLYRYKWSRQRLNDQYFQVAQTYLEKNAMLNANLVQSNDLKVCDICCSYKKLIKSTFCQHHYCYQCWENYIQQMLNNGIIFFQCMEKCPISPLLPHVFVGKYFPHLLQPYLKQICINYSNINKQISYCPSTQNQNCELFCQQSFSLTMSVSQMLTWIQCQCGECYCFECRKQPHYPISCQDINKWNKRVNVEEGSLQWIEKNTRKCPKCKVCVQKYIGCSYIKCVCGAQFCYDCSRNWDQFHKDQKGECLLVMKKKSSLEQRTTTQQFLQLQQKLMAINRTLKKNLKTFTNIIYNIEIYHPQEGWASQRLKQIRKQIKQCWWIYKWSLAGLFLYKKQSLSLLIEDDFVQSITNLMEVLEKIEKIGKKIDYKDLLLIKNDLTAKRQSLKNNKNTWLDAWRNS